MTRVSRLDSFPSVPCLAPITKQIRHYVTVDKTKGRKMKPLGKEHRGKPPDSS